MPLLPVLQGAPPQYYSSRQMLVGSPCLETTQAPDDMDTQVRGPGRHNLQIRRASERTHPLGLKRRDSFESSLSTILGAERLPFPVLNITVALCVPVCLVSRRLSCFTWACPPATACLLWKPPCRGSPPTRASVKRTARGRST